MVLLLGVIIPLVALVVLVLVVLVELLIWLTPVWGQPLGKGWSVTSDQRGVVSCDDDYLRREDIEVG